MAANPQERTMRDVKFGLFLPTHDFMMAKAAALRAEELGFYSVSINDHFFPPMGPEMRKVPQLECYTTLGALAAVTKRVKLVPAMTAMSFRNPALLAKMTSTLDHISGGRFIAGVGSGWLRDEYHANGYPYPSNAERIDQLGEALRVLKAMWTQEEPAYKGQYFKIEKAYNFPHPVQKPHPPIMVGGSGSRLLKVTAQEADIANLVPPITTGVVDMGTIPKFTKTELKKRIGLLHQFASAAGRDPDAIEISGLVTVLPASSKEEAESSAKGIAASMGFADAQAARNSPTFLIGTADELKREIRLRIEEFAMTYWIVVFMSDQARDLFAQQVMSSL